jgi:hypothetical protein
LALRRLARNDLEGSGRVVVTAFTTASHRVDADVEKIVGRLSLEPTVLAARWQAERSSQRPSHRPNSTATPHDPVASTERPRLDDTAFV